MCGYVCIEFINYILKGESLLDFTNLVSSNAYENSDKITLEYFSITKNSFYE